MYRSSSPFAPENQYQNQPSYPPAAPPTSTPAGQIAPGAVTYTTSTGPDGRVIYHPFKAVAASYQTPSGVVSGIQWVPAEATQILPAGAQPASSDFAASWNRGYLSKEDQKALKEWQRGEEKRRKKEEKESKRIREKDRRPELDPELQYARERDAQAAAARERRKSFTGPTTPGVAFPGSGTSGTGGYPAASPAGPGYPSSPYSIYSNLSGGNPAQTSYNPPAVGAPGSPYMRDRKYSSGAPLGGELDRQMGEMELRGGGAYNTEGERKGALPRPQKYSRNEAAQEAPRAVSGNYGDRQYGSAGGYPAAPGPYTAARSYPAAAPPASNQYPPSPYSGNSPNIRPTEVAPYPGANYSSSPRPPEAYIPHSTTQFSAPPAASSPQVYPRGHVLEGQPIPARSRATTPIPGAGPPAATGYTHGYPQQPTASPRMPEGQMVPREHGQLAAPEGFSRPINASQSYSAFDPLKIQVMDELLNGHLPRMPHPLQTHDIYQEDWSRFLQDITLAWSGKLPVPDLVRGGIAPKRTTLAADLIDLWNASFFTARGVELILYKGRERRSGPNANQFDDDDDDESSLSSSESSTESDSDDDEGPYPSALGPYGGGAYGRPKPEYSEARRRRREARAEKRKRRKERRARRRARAKEQRFILYAVCIPRGMPSTGSMSSGMPGGYAGSGGGY